MLEAIPNEHLTTLKIIFTDYGKAQKGQSIFMWKTFHTQGKKN